MKFKVAQITDLHLDEDFPKEQGVEARKNLKKVLKDIKLHGISEVVCTGDIGENQSVAYFFNSLKNHSLSLTLGNHDAYKVVAKHYSEGTHPKDKKLYSSVEKHGYKFIYLDSSNGYIDHTQLAWLSRELESSLSLVIFTHHPIIGLDLMVDEIAKLENREEVLYRLEASSKAITIFCGHYHMEDHQVHKKINQYITPAVSYQIEKKKNEIAIDSHNFGYRILTFHQGEISSEVQIFNAE